jgi:hypothetical protein
MIQTNYSSAHTLGRAEIEDMCDNLLCMYEREQVDVLRDMALECLEARIAAVAAPSGPNDTEMRVLREISDELHLHGHGLAAARVERRIHLLSLATECGKSKT